MEKFKHYGVEVIYQSIEKPFEEVLKENNIKYTVLPYLDDIVFKYEKDGVRKYAYIEYPNVPGAYIEHVFITTEIPEDLSWRNIAEDYELQKNNGTPMQLHTRAYLLYHAAEHEVLSQEPFVFDLTVKTDRKKIDFELLRWGYNLERLKEMDHYDCPEIDED